MKLLQLFIVVGLVAGCADDLTESSTASATASAGIGSTQYSAVFTYTEDFGGDTATVTVDVKELGFTFRIAVTSSSLFVCEIVQGVIQDGRRVNLNSNQFTGPLELDSENYIPNNYDGCETLFPSIAASGDVYMASRMSMDAARSFQFIFN